MAKPKKESKPETFRACVAAQVRMARANKKLSQVEVAERARMSPARLSEIENGLTDPRISTVERLAKVLDLNLTVGGCAA